MWTVDCFLTLAIFEGASKCRLLNIWIFFVTFSCFEIQAALYQIRPPTPRVGTLMRCRIAHTHTILCQCPDSIPACPRCTNWSSCSWQLGPWPSLCRQSAACCSAAVLHSGYTAQWSNLGVYKDITSTVFELQKWFLHKNGVELCKKCNASDKSVNFCAQCGQTGRNADKIPRHTS